MLQVAKKHKNKQNKLSWIFMWLITLVNVNKYSHLLKKSLMKNLIFCDSILDYLCEIGMERGKSYNLNVSLNVYLNSSEYRSK